MSRPTHNAVFDCVVYAQYMINMQGPAAHCLEEVRRGFVRLFASSRILLEVQALPFKISRQYDITIEDAAQLAEEIRKIATIVDNAQPLYVHPIDPDDSEYINLALATNSELIVSRDRHLLNLMDVQRPHARDFHKRFPQLLILSPDQFARQLREEERQANP